MTFKGQGPNRLCAHATEVGLRMCNGIRLFIWEEHLVNPTQVVYQHISGCSHILVTCSSCLIRRVPCYIFFSSLVAVFLLRFFPVRTYGQTPSLGETRISINLYIQIITRKIIFWGTCSNTIQTLLHSDNLYHWNCKLKFLGTNKLTYLYHLYKVLDYSCTRTH